jgi:hypothetical protein
VSAPRYIAEKLVRRWVRLYTVGLEADDRHNRSAEIDSDLWEHRTDALNEGDSPASTSLSILGRWIAGLPADLSWRASQVRRNGQTTKERMMTNPLGKYWWQALAVLTAGATVYAGIRQFFTDEVSVGASPGKIVALVLFVGAGAVTFLGLALHRTRPRLSAGLVIGGVLPLALVGGFGIAIVVGLVASLMGGEGWWWIPVGIGSAIGTAAGVGAVNSWWHAARSPVVRSPRVQVLPIGLVLAGLLVAGIGVSLGLYTIPLLSLGAVTVLIGIRLWSRHLKTAQ